MEGGDSKLAARRDHLALRRMSRTPSGRQLASPQHGVRRPTLKPHVEEKSEHSGEGSPGCSGNEDGEGLPPARATVASDVETEQQLQVAQARSRRKSALLGFAASQAPTSNRAGRRGSMRGSPRGGGGSQKSKQGLGGTAALSSITESPNLHPNRPDKALTTLGVRSMPAGVQGGEGGDATPSDEAGINPLRAAVQRRSAGRGRTPPPAPSRPTTPTGGAGRKPSQGARPRRGTTSAPVRSPSAERVAGAEQTGSHAPPDRSDPPTSGTVSSVNPLAAAATATSRSAGGGSAQRKGGFKGLPPPPDKPPVPRVPKPSKSPPRVRPAGTGKVTNPLHSAAGGRSGR